MSKCEADLVVWGPNTAHGRSQHIHNSDEGSDSEPDQGTHVGVKMCKTGESIACRCAY